MIIIDRFEGELVVVEYEEKFYNIPRTWLPVGAKEGDLVAVTIAVDEEASARRREDMERQVNDLFE